MNLPNGPELIIVLILAMVLFGSKKLPGAARSLGQSLRIFKAETKGLRDDYKDGLDGKDDAAVHRGEILADQKFVGTHAPGQPVGVPVTDLDRREEELRRREEILRREEELRMREEALRRETESR
ncbi:MAG: twin-arginine translocase TatA/TatE family subunit [Actinomycetota bacterium]